MSLSICVYVFNCLITYFLSEITARSLRHRYQKYRTVIFFSLSVLLSVHFQPAIRCTTIGPKLFTNEKNRWFLNTMNVIPATINAKILILPDTRCICNSKIESTITIQKMRKKYCKGFAMIFTLQSLGVWTSYVTHLCWRSESYE